MLAVALGTVLCVPALAACGHGDRPPKPSCPAGQHAEWDDDEWDCERDKPSSGSNSGGSRPRSGRR